MLKRIVAMPPKSYLCRKCIDMKNNIIIVLVCLLLPSIATAQEFNDFFSDKTLRVDYIFSGNQDKQYISLDELSQLPSWAGRRHNLSDLPLKGNGEIEMKDKKTGTIIYRTSFSTLFQEWLTTDEAKSISKGFENTYLLPYPLLAVDIKVSLKDSRGNVTTSLTHTVDPIDILIHKRGTDNITPHRYIIKNGTPEDCIDVIILGEGYTKNELDTFYIDAQKACENILSYEPFKSFKNKFNFIAVASESKDSGVSTPGKGIWKNTIFNSHFNTFYSDRYLTTRQVKAIHNVIAGIPYEHIIILANTKKYGGGGIYNAFTLTTAHHESFLPVVVHEFGHSFAGLADEYFYEQDVFSDTYPFDVEPWEQNITTLVNFKEKWKDMLPDNIPIPTTPNSKEPYKIGVYEGGGYSAKGIYRPAFNCRMRTNNATTFCPVCQRAIERMIKFYTDK